MAFEVIFTFSLSSILKPPAEGRHYDARLELVKDRPHRQTAFEVLERLHNRGRGFLDEVGAQQIPAFA